MLSHRFNDEVDANLGEVRDKKAAFPEAIESENERNEYIDMAIKLGEDLDFLRCIYTDFISGGIDNDD